jgi:hypothetical protein
MQSVANRRVLACSVPQCSDTNRNKSDAAFSKNVCGVTPGGGAIGGGKGSSPYRSSGVTELFFTATVLLSPPVTSLPPASRKTLCNNEVRLLHKTFWINGDNDRHASVLCVKRMALSKTPSEPS